MMGDLWAAHLALFYLGLASLASVFTAMCALSGALSLNRIANMLDDVRAVKDIESILPTSAAAVHDAPQYGQ